jgi:hypothetical protein|eukprot:COSAG06_NODE_26540_length_612_cov_1.306043_2_plen_61_part_00
MKGPSDAPLAYVGLAMCALLGLVFLHGWLTQPPGAQQPSKLAARRNRNVLKRMGFTDKDE